AYRHQTTGARRSCRDLPSPYEKRTHKGFGGRKQLKGTDIDDATLTNDDAVGIEKVDSAANLAVLNGVEHALDFRNLVVHQVDEAGRPIGNVEVNRMTGVDIESTKGVKATRPATDQRGRRHVGDF